MGVRLNKYRYSMSMLLGVLVYVGIVGWAYSGLLSLLRSPIVSMWIVVFLFDASHLPLFVLGNHISLSWWQWFLVCTFPLAPTGWVFGFIYYRLKSVLLGALFHTYITIWGGFPFLS